MRVSWLPEFGRARVIADRGLKRSGRIVVVTAVAGVLLAAGCSDGEQPASTPSPSAAESPTAPPPTEATTDPEHVPALDAYEAFVRAAAEAANRGEPDYPALSDHADGPALVRTRAAIEDHAENGRVYRGRPVLDTIEVTHFDPEAPPEDVNARVLACVDISDYVLVYEDDGSPVPVDRGLERYEATADLWLTDDRWLVIDIEELRDRPC